jgi:hypothetical protein
MYYNAPALKQAIVARPFLQSQEQAPRFGHFNQSASF